MTKPYKFEQIYKHFVQCEFTKTYISNITITTRKRLRKRSIYFNCSQKKATEVANINYVLDPNNCTYDNARISHVYCSSCIQCVRRYPKIGFYGRSK